MKNRAHIWMKMNYKKRIWRMITEVEKQDTQRVQSKTNSKGELWIWEDESEGTVDGENIFLLSKQE